MLHINWKWVLDNKKSELKVKIQTVANSAALNQSTKQLCQYVGFLVNKAWDHPVLLNILKGYPLVNPSEGKFKILNCVYDFVLSTYYFSQSYSFV